MCVQRMRLQATWSRTLSDNIICLSSHPPVWSSTFFLQIFVFLIISSVDVQFHNEFSPQWGPQDPGWVKQGLYIFLSVCVSFPLSVHPRRFQAIIRVPNNLMQPQATWSNTLSGYKICSSLYLFFCLSVRYSSHTSVLLPVCPSVHPSAHPPGLKRAFCNFLFVFISNLGVQHQDAFISTLGFRGPLWGTVELICLYVLLFDSLFFSLSLCISFLMYASLFGDYLPSL